MDYVLLDLYLSTFRGPRTGKSEPLYGAAFCSSLIRTAVGGRNKNAPLFFRSQVSAQCCSEGRREIGVVVDGRVNPKSANKKGAFIPGCKCRTSLCGKLCNWASVCFLSAILEVESATVCCHVALLKRKSATPQQMHSSSKHSQGVLMNPGWRR